MKCELCHEQIQETFLKKLLGTVMKDEKGKKHYVCRRCQQENQDKPKILARL
ncbi:hypothetical protein HY491_00535 [Candidatus Woesearchaeota archaeon]|nr:hypothetical protein [Candidatus Woesearchaeota archaeon]